MSRFFVKRKTVSVTVFFESAAKLRTWLEAHHKNTSELWVGFLKKATGKPSVTYPEALDEALCFGWIDGVRKSIDAERYMIRFTPRKKDSYWSAVNTKRAAELKKRGRMAPAGLAAFEARDAERTRKYSFEREAAVFPPELERKFKGNKRAWMFFQTLPPGVRRVATHWVVSAARDETRQRRLAQLIEASADGRRPGIIAKPKQ